MQVFFHTGVVLLSIYTGILHTVIVFQLWSTGAQVQWSGPIPGPADDIGTLAFKAFQEQQVIGWDQAIRERLSKTWGEAKHVILHHLFESRGYGHPGIMECTPGEIAVAIRH